MPLQNYDNFLWKDVIVKEVFKENHTKYHYKNHLFEQGVKMNKVELMKKAQMYFGRATGYGNNGSGYLQMMKLEDRLL